MWLFSHVGRLHKRRQLSLLGRVGAQLEAAPFPLTRWGYAAAAFAGVGWVMFSYSIGLR